MNRKGSIDLLDTGEAMHVVPFEDISFCKEASPDTISLTKKRITMKKIVLFSFILFAVLVYFIGVFFLKDLFTRHKSAICIGIVLGATFIWSCPLIPLEYSSFGIIFAVTFSGVLSGRDFGMQNTWSSIQRIGQICFSRVSILLLGSCLLSTFFRNNSGKDLILPYLLGGRSRNSSLMRCMLLSLVLSGVISNVTAPIIILSVLTDAVEDTGTAPDKSLIMCVALSSNIGGMLLPISSPQSVLGSSLIDISWRVWLFFSLPIAAVCSCFVYALLFYVFPSSDQHTIFDTSNITPISKEKKIKIILAIVLCIICWSVTSIFSFLHFAYFVPIIILSLSENASAVFNRKTFEILSIAIAGTSLGLAIERTALLKDAIPSLILRNREYSLLFAIMTLSLFMLLASCLVCHTVSAAVILPILQKVGAALHREKLLLSVATFACSCGMAFPSSGFPNILSSGVKTLSGKRVVSTLQFTALGIVSTFMCWIIILSVGISCMLLAGF